MRISDWSSDVCSSDLFVFQSEQILRLKRVRQALGASERWPSCVRRKQDFEGRLWSSIADALQRLFRTLQRSDLKLRGNCQTVSPCAPQIFAPDRKSVATGKSGTDRGEQGGGRSVRNT